jgi:hypothetical protein
MAALFAEAEAAEAEDNHKDDNQPDAVFAKKSMATHC